MNAPPAGAVVSVEAIHALALATHDNVIEIKTLMAERERQFEKLEVRVRSLERWRLAHLAAGGGAATAVSFLLRSTGHG